MGDRFLIDLMADMMEKSVNLEALEVQMRVMCDDAGLLLLLDDYNLDRARL